MGHDLRFALRMLRKQPGFTVVAVVTLALGLGANTAIFGIVSAFFFQPLPVKDPDRLVLLLQKSSLWKFPHGHSWLDYQDYRTRVAECEDMLALFLSPLHLAAAGQQPERTWFEAVSGNYFRMLGVEPALGRLFVPGEAERPGADAVVVISHGYWQRKFGEDPSIVGRTIQLNGRPFTVIGITPAGFNGAQWAIAPSVWIPATMLGQVLGTGESLLKERGAPAFKVMARLKPGVRLAQAKAAVEVVARQLAAEYPKDHRDATVLVVPEKRSRPEPTFSEFMPFAAAAFMALVGLVLIIACANVANLMFSRAVTRQREMGIRIAVGASRGQVLRQLLVESALLGMIAGAVGLVLAQVAGRLISGFNPAGDMPIRTDQPWDWRVFGFTVLVSVLAGIVTGFGPAWRSAQVDVQATLKEGSGPGTSSRRHLFRSALVVSQVALSVAVLVGGGLFLQSLRRAARLELGFQPEQLVMASLDLGLQGYEDDRGRQFLRTLLQDVRALPGVTAASVAGAVPFDYGVLLRDVGAEGRTREGDPGKDGYVVATFNPVDAEYFGTLGVPLLRGRGFNRSDDPTSIKVAVINQTMAQRLWPDEDALGKRFRLDRGGGFVTVVGIARDGKYVMLGEEPRPHTYLPLDQFYQSPVTLHVRTEGKPADFLPAIRSVLHRLDPNLPIYNERTMEEHLRKSAMALMPLRTAASLAGVQGLVGLVLAVMGIYGLVSYGVGQRTKEIGIRLALGAPPWEVLRLVIRQGWHLTLIGLAIGTVLALGMSLGLSRLLYGLHPVNLPVFGSVLVLLTAVALVACYWPARRATRVDPMVALRCE